MKTTSNRFAVAAAFGLICLAPAALAQAPAAGSTDLPSIRVSYADLNVATDAGMRTLTSRVNNAVRRVCAQSIDPRELNEVLECRTQSRRDAWQQFAQHQERAQARRNTENAAIANRPEAR